MNVQGPSTTSNSGRRSRAVITLMATLMATLTVGCHGGAKGRPGGDALPDWPSDPNWQRYVLGPDRDDMTPVAIKRAHGNVTTPEALVNRYGTTTMTVAPGGPPAVIVLDYGREVGGTPHVDVSDASGSPQVRISTSEALPFLNANTTTTPVQAAAAGATNLKVSSIAPFYAGTAMTVGAGDAAQTVTVTEVGSAAAPDTSLVLPAAAGASKVNVASMTGYVLGGPLTIGSGASAQQTTITGVGTAAGAPTAAVYPAAAGDANVQIASAAGFAIGDSVLIGSGDAATVRITTDVGTAAITTGLVAGASAGDSNVKVASVAGLTAGAQIDIAPGSAQDHVTITNVGTAGVNTSVSVANTTSATMLRVASIAGFAPGDTISIGAGADQETRIVASASGTGTNQIVTVTEPLTVAHAPGAAVLDTTRPGTGIDFTPALSGDHAMLSTLASPGTGLSFSPPLDGSLEVGTAIRGAGSGITFSPALTSNAALGSTVSSSGTGVSFTPALATAHAAGETISSIGTYVNDNGAQINLTIAGPDTYTGGLRGGFRFEAIELRSAGTVTLSGAGLNFKAYRATSDQYKGWFASSDDQLNRMWYAGAYTAQMDMVPVGVNTCFQKPVIFDGAKRDRAIWSGDLMVSDPVALLSLGSNAAPYVTGSIDAFIGLQAVTGRLTSAVGFRSCGAFDYAVSYSAASAMIAVQYYRYTGDTAYITALLPNLEAALAYSASRLDENGLIVTNDNDYWQTRQNGEVTHYNLVHYEFLQDMIWLESHIGTPAKVAQYTADAAALKDAINARLFNSAAGLYQHTDSRPDVFPLDANMNAVKLGVAPAAQVQHILDYFRAAWVEHGSEISQPSPSMADPFGHTIEPLNNTWEMLARLRSNDAAGALDLMRRLWGLQVDPDSGYYTGTFWEFVLQNGLPSRGFDSLSHAWGAGPTQVLTEAVVGATAVGPGYATWEVKPQPVDLAWAQGQVPTAYGPLLVKWAQDDQARAGAADGRFHLEVTAPAGTSGEVWVPLSSADKSVSRALTPGANLLRRDGKYDVYSVGEGTYELSSAPVGAGSP